MRRKEAPEKEKDNTERWLLSYADFITLLLIFFIVMYSMSKVDADKFKAVASALNVALGGGARMEIIQQDSSGSSIVDTGGGTQTPASQNQAGQSSGNAGQGDTNSDKMTLENIQKKIQKFSQDNGLQAQLMSSIEERGLVVSIQDTLLFESGSADVTSTANDVLIKISSVLASAPNYIKIEGHTDNLPINTSRFHSNWELSVLRATNVLQIMQNAGGIDPKRLSATGYGEYRPIASNDTDAGRQENRRVDLVILRSQYDLVEPGQNGDVTPSADSASGSPTSNPK